MEFRAGNDFVRRIQDNFRSMLLRTRRAKSGLVGAGGGSGCERKYTPLRDTVMLRKPRCSRLEKESEKKNLTLKVIDKIIARELSLMAKEVAEETSSAVGTFLFFSPSILLFP